jgi:GT2 family glycosyltransferase
LKPALKIDLLISTRNRLVELLYTIKHFLNIGFSQGQIYIIDDASTDGTFETISANYPEIEIFRNETAKGYIYNRNQLMNKTMSAYILSLDDDSHIRTMEDIEEAIHLLETKTSYGIFTFKPFEQLDEPPLKSQLPDTVREVRTYIGCGHLIKREVIERLGKYREEFEFYCEELDYSIRAYQAGYKVITKDNLIVHHRIDWSSRNKQFESDVSKGVYGAVYRSSLGFSNNLIVTRLYYPFPFDYLFVVYYTLLRFKNFYLKKDDKEGFLKGWKRYRTFKKYIDAHRTPMSMTLFLHWIKLEVR